MQAGPHGFLPLAEVPRRGFTGWVSWEDGPADQPGSSPRFPSLLLDVAAVCEALLRPEWVGSGARRHPITSFILHLLEHGYGRAEQRLAPRCCQFSVGPGQAGWLNRRPAALIATK